MIKSKLLKIEKDGCKEFTIYINDIILFEHRKGNNGDNKTKLLKIITRRAEIEGKVNTEKMKQK